MTFRPARQRAGQGVGSCTCQPIAQAPGLDIYPRMNRKSAGVSTGRTVIVYWMAGKSTYWLAFRPCMRAVGEGDDRAEDAQTVSTWTEVSR